jgi:hypothetical protein
MCRTIHDGALWRLLPVVLPEYLGAIRANFAMLRSLQRKPSPIALLCGTVEPCACQNSLDYRALQTYDCAVLRWPFEELRPKGRAAPKSPQTTKPIDRDWGGRWAFFVLGTNGAELIKVSEC